MFDNTNAQLQQAYALIKQGQKADALEILRPILSRQPNNAEGWWMMANAVPSTVDAVLACQKVLALQPDHTEARTRMLELQQQSAKALADKYYKKDIKTHTRKTRWWVVFGLTGLLILVLT